MHPAAFKWVEKHAGTFGRVVEFGSRDVNGSVRRLFTADEYLGIDLMAGPGVDVVADAADVSLAGYDVVVCCEVLEHHPHPLDLVQKAHDALVDGGTFLMTCAGPGRSPHSAIDGGPVRPGEHYANVSPDDFCSWLEKAGFASCDWEMENGDLRAVARKASCG